VLAIRLTPLETTRSEFVRGERTRTRGEGDGDDHGLLSVPRLVVGHDARVRDDVLGRELWQLAWLCVDPTLIN
jgi:hypothetical protein